jgi:hypothetical protein
MAEIQLPSTFVPHKRNRVEGDVAYLTLSKGYVAVIDASDVLLVGQYCWSTLENRNSIYAMRNSSHNRGPRTLLLHREIMGAPKGMMVDHIDGDGLNNRRSNLRLATNAQNLWNTGRRVTNSSGYKGVSFDKQKGKWHARIRRFKKYYHLGFFDNPEQAHQAYVSAAKEFHGEFANAHQIAISA